MNTLPLLSLINPNFNLGLFVLLSLFIPLPLQHCLALELRSISGPPETSGSINPGGVMVVGCTLQYPGALDRSSTVLYLVGTDGNRTQVSFSSLNSSTTAQSFSTVSVPGSVQSGYYFLVAVESANRTVIASSPNFQISSAIVNSNSTSSAGPSPTKSTGENTSSPNNKETDTGAIAGGVVGGVFGVGLVVLLGLVFVRRRRKKAWLESSRTDMTEYFVEPTPFLGVAPTNEARSGDGSGTHGSKLEERRLEMLGQRERLQRHLDDLQHTQSEGSGSLMVLPASDGTVPELQRQMDVMTRRIAVLEAELADQPPPEYVSRSEYNS